MITKEEYPYSCQDELKLFAFLKWARERRATDAERFEAEKIIHKLVEMLSPLIQTHAQGFFSRLEKAGLSDPETYQFFLKAGQQAVIDAVFYYYPQGRATKFPDHASKWIKGYIRASYQKTRNNEKYDLSYLKHPSTTGSP